MNKETIMSNDHIIEGNDRFGKYYYWFTKRYEDDEVWTVTKFRRFTTENIPDLDSMDLTVYISFDGKTPRQAECYPNGFTSEEVAIYDAQVKRHRERINPKIEELARGILVD